MIRPLSHTLILTYLMSALGLAAISLVETVSVPFLMLAGFGITASAVLNLKGLKMIPARVWNAVAAVLFIFFVADYAAISGSLIVSASRFLAILAVLKLFDLRKNRDYFIVYALVFFQILAAAASTVSPLFLPILVSYVMLGIWAMVLFTIKRDLSDWKKREEEVPPSLFGPSFFVSIVLISAASLAITMALFFIMPRMGMGFFERKTLNTLKVSGFSDKVDLGAIGPVKSDPTVVMRVELPGGLPGEPIYMRGAVLDSYDGSSWTRVGVKSATLIRGNYGGFIRLRQPAGRLIEQNILLEPLDTDALFAAPFAVAVEGRFSNLWLDRSGSVRLPSPPYSRFEYRAWSSLGPLSGDGTDGDYLDISFLDDNPDRERIKALAAGITAGKTTAEEKARAIESHLKNKYSYTLDPKRDPSRGPLEDFLFYSGEGYCEHYATAMAILLRAAGIPSRLVTGFTQGEWNGLGNYFIIRQRDAHSWVEAHIGGAWHTFDPTPAAGVAGYSRPGTLALYLDLFRLRWNRYVIHFSFADQRKIARNLESGSSRLLNELRLAASGASASVKKFALPAAAAALCAVALFIILKRQAGLRGKAGKTPPFYLEMLEVLEKKGIRKRPEETPREFAERTSMPAVKEITDVFQYQRYGGGVPGRADMAKMRKALEEIKKAAAVKR